MSKIDEMLKRMCPGGVEYVEIGEVCDFITGFSFRSSTFRDEGLPVCRTTNIQNGYIDFSNMVFFDKNDYAEDLDKFIIRKNDIVIGMSGTIKVGISCADRECYLNQRVGKFLPGSRLDYKYLYYVLCNSIGEIVNGIGDGSVKNLSNKDIKGFRILLPPLEIQKEIVKVLDKFTEYDTELQARIKQYGYYRDKFLSFDDNGQWRVAYRKIKEIAQISRGVVISKQDIKECPGQYPVYSSQTEDNGVLGYINKYAYDGEYLTWTTDGANAGTVFYRDGRFNITNVCGLLRIDNDAVDLKYLYYFLTVEAPKHVTKGMGNAKLMSNTMANIIIPIPPLKIQNRIVSVLDNFDKICSDLKIGLPAEIEKRQQQYEFYRDAILTFVEKGEVTEQRERESIRRIIQYIFGYVTVRLGECCAILDSQRRPITKSARSHGEYPYYGANGIQDYVNDFIFDGEYVLVGEDGSVMNDRGNPVVTWASGKIWVNNHAHVIQNNAESSLRYLYYFLQTVDVSAIVHGNIPKVNQKDFRSLKIKLPPLAKQRQIVEVLDRFDQLCYDLRGGLPAEIEKRQKQYEYYRDKLLMFEPKS